jgi:citrate synthase
LKFHIENKMQNKDETVPDFAKLKIGNEAYELPIKKATIGENVIDVSKLYASTGYFTFDPGFMSTGSCESKITYIDGDAGILRHRGYEIKDLAEKCDFLEVSYLLLNGELPNKEQHKDFTSRILHHSLVN